MTAPPRRVLRPVLYLLLGLAAVDAVVVLNRDVWERHSPDDYAERITGCRQRGHDLIIVGGSPVSEGFDPAAFDGLVWRGQAITDGYSIGLPGGTATDFYFALRAATTGQTPPRLVIYGVTATDLNDARNEPHGPYSVWTWADYVDSLATRPDSREWATRRFLEGRVRRGWALFRYRHGIKMAAAHAAESVAPGLGGPAADEARKARAYSAALRTGRGYAPADFFIDTRYDESKAAGKKPAPFDFLNKYRTGSHARYVLKIADWCAAHGTDLVLVDMPVTANLETKYPAALAEYRQLMAALLAERPLPVVRATRDKLGLTDADFADIIHLNGAGASKFSAWVRRELDGLGARP